jgi:dihydrofolate synthase/folylpolyglutamate synthase
VTAEVEAAGPGDRATRILSRLEMLGVKLGLDSTREILAALGDPQRSTPAVLVAGTNGKGSTAALIASIASAAGYRTGLYTSPHLERVEERIRLDGREIAPQRLGELLERVLAAAEERVGAPPTYFEALTEAAFLHFADEGADLAVMETGLGGRLDATNVTEPIVSVITEIGLDHMQHLGSTIGRIAREKAGILRPGRRAIVWAGEREAAVTVSEVARSIGADLEWVGETTPPLEEIEFGVGGQRVRLKHEGSPLELSLHLAGRHQQRNLRLALGAAAWLRDLGFDRIDRRALESGVAACRWPGRLELVERADGPPVLLDAAHNPHAVEALIDFLDEVAPQYDLLFGALADKRVERMLPALAARAGTVLLTAPQSYRAVRPERLRSLLPRSRGEVEIAPSTEAAMELAWRPDAPLLVACGSIYLVGEVRGWLGRLAPRPPAARRS